MSYEYMSKLTILWTIFFILYRRREDEVQLTMEVQLTIDNGQVTDEVQLTIDN